MRTRSHNPFLPKPTSIRWRKGPFAKKRIEADPLSSDNVATSDAGNESGVLQDKPTAVRKHSFPNGRIGSDRQKMAVARVYPHAGKLSFSAGDFYAEGNTGWGTTLDMLALMHGPVGCGAFPQTTRLIPPNFVQGVESFTSIHACTDLKLDDLADCGDAKLGRALDEAQTLFPLANGVAILNEDPISFIDDNVKGIAKAKTNEIGKPIIPVPGIQSSRQALDKSTMPEVSANDQGPLNSYDVAVPFYREATGLVWIVSKLLSDIGLNPLHEFTCSSTSEKARIRQCKVVIAFTEKLDDPLGHLHESYAQPARQWYGMPPIWTCFLGPSATDASLRAIAARFDWKIQRHAEDVIAANRKKVEAVIALYRSRLQGKLVLILDAIPETQLETFRLLGMRVGTTEGWPGKTGVWRIPRLLCNCSEKAISSYIAEAKPDIVIHYQRDEFDWRKRGLAGLPFSQLFDRGNNFFWGYDGFACFAAALDRHLNAPWRKLLKPPWPNERR